LSFPRSRKVQADQSVGGLHPIPELALYLRRKLHHNACVISAGKVRE